MKSMAGQLLEKMGNKKVNEGNSELSNLIGKFRFCYNRLDDLLKSDNKSYEYTIKKMMETAKDVGDTMSDLYTMINKHY